MIKKFSNSAVRAVVVSTCLLGASSVVFAVPTVDLTGLGFVQYGDAQSYSMPVANYQYGFNTNNGPFAIPSTPGQISSLTVLGTGSEGQPVTTNNDGMDHAYSTPTGVSGEKFFYANQVTNRGVSGTVNNNGNNTWDASLASLKDFLNGEQMAVFFNNNQINSGDASLQSLAAWARVWITDPNGNNVGDAYELTNMGGNYNLVTQGGGGQFLGDVTTYTAAGSGAGNPSKFGTGVNGSNDGTDFVLSGGAICVLTGPAFPVPTPIACDAVGPFPPGTVKSAPINHNLGADHVAYTLLFPELNAALDQLFTANPADLADYTMHVDMRLGCAAKTVDGTGTKNDPFVYSTTAASNWMACDVANGFGKELNNGYEQIFIGTAKVGVCPPDNPQCNPTTVPEPGGLVLFATALGLLGWNARRKAH